MLVCYRTLTRPSVVSNWIADPFGPVAVTLEKDKGLTPFAIDWKTKLATLPEPLKPLAISVLENPMVHVPEELSIFCRKGTSCPNRVAMLPWTTCLSSRT